MNAKESAKEFYESVKYAREKLARSYERYAELMLCDIPPISYDEGHSGNVNQMANIDAAIDYLQIVKAREEAVRELMDEATAILYGNSGNGGLAKLKKPNCEQTYQVNADAIAMHYLQGMSWKAIARDSEIYSDKEIRNFAMSGLSAIDRKGKTFMKEHGNEATG